MQQISFKEGIETGSLFLVPTPIGNLEDMTYRAVRTLKEVDIILAEDTRNTVKLLNHYEINGPLLKSFHDHSRESEVQGWLQRLIEGESIALVSDAGMPLINDPGHPLVQACLHAGVPVVALPGANAALTALVASGLISQQFTYYGFFPRANKAQKLVLGLVGEREETAIFYESPHRIKQAIKAIAMVLPPYTQVVIARELTKRYEEYLRGSVEELATHLQERILKGEIVLLIEGGTGLADPADTMDNLPLADQVNQLIEEGLNTKEAIKDVAKRRGLKKQVVYNAYHGLDENS